jgi:uracil-DNA glycosylase family 4
MRPSSRPSSPHRTRSHTATAAPLLDAIRARVVSCDRCPRLRQYCAEVARAKRRAFRGETYWGRPVPGHGDPDARLLVVGLAPAAHGANRTGRMFTGDGPGGSGDFLMASMYAAGFASSPTSQDPKDGLSLRDAYLTAAVRCAPPDNTPTPAELASCQPFLDEEFRALRRVAVVVALGRLAHDATVRLLVRAGLASAPRPRFGHGARHMTASDLELLDCYHPSRQNTQTGLLTAPMMTAVFQTARSIIDGRAGA